MSFVSRRSSRRVLSVIPALALAFGLLIEGDFAQTAPDPQLLDFPGGFLESATTGVARPLLAPSVIQTLLPARGPFTFPAPYGTSGVRLTNATDCGGGDCVNAVGYAYWRNINNHVGSSEMLIFLGLSKARGGQGPTLFSYDKTTEQVTKLGPLFDPSSGRSEHSGEGWYFSATQPTKMYMDDGPRMLRFDVLSKQVQTVFDVRAQFGADKIVWQMHSSDDDRVHSATLRSTPSYEMLGCVVYHEDTAQFQYFPKIGEFDECQLDKSGRWLMSLENVDGLYDVENRIFDLQTGTERLIWDQDGAVAHDDMGYGYVVGPDNWNALPNAEYIWDFTTNPLSKLMVSHTLLWDAPAPNHLSHTNARPGVSPAQQYACGSGASRAIVPWSNEIICFPLDGSLDVLVVAPVMTDLNAPGGGDDYVKQPKGNLDVTGQYFIWTSNTGGNRLDAFIVKVPAQILMGSSSDTTPPSVALTAPDAASAVSGTVAVSAGASDNMGVAGVQFRLDGASLGTEDTAAPYTISWNTTQAAAGPHTLTAMARDAAGNTALSAPVAVTVGNDTTAPVISAVAATGLSSSGATITWTTGEAADTQVEYGATTSYGTLSTLGTSLVTAHSQALAGLAAATLYHYRVRSRDAAGNLAVSGDFTFTTLSAPPPTGGTGPIGVWTLNEAAGTIAADGSGNGFNGTLVNGPAWTAGMQGSALSFDGLDDYVGVPHAAALDAYPLSVAFWLKTGATGQRGLVNKYLPSSFNGYQVFVDAGNLCAWYFRDASNYVWNGTGCGLATPGVTDNRWHHVALVVDDAGGRLYVDGTLRASRAWSGTPGATTTTAGLSFGRYPGVSGAFLPGSLDEVRVYSRALGATEIAALVASPDVTAPVISAVAATGLSSSDATITWTTGEASDTQVEYGPSTSYGALSSLVTTMVTAHSQALAGLAAGTLYHYRVRSRDAAGNLAVSGDFTFTTAVAPPPPGTKRGRPVGHWKVNEGSGTIASDSSGNGSAGTLVNGPAWAAGVLDQGLVFDGLDDYVDVPHAAALDAYPLSVVFWVKTGATGQRGLVNKYLPSSFNGYQVFVDGGNLCAWYFRDASSYVWDGTGCALATPGVTDDRWHHVALVVDDAGGRLYVDGDLKTSRAWSGTPGAATTTAGLSLGRYPGVSDAFLPGMLDDVRVYARALSADEVAGLWDGAAH
jgi:hypothetical protein